jgi:hypothetical protein
MTIKARYENGVFRPLEDVRVKEGTIAEVYFPGERRAGKKPRSVMDTGFFGMWKDREDIPDGVEYVNRIRKYRREPESERK